VLLFTLWNKYTMLVCRRNTAPGYTDDDMVAIAKAGKAWLQCAKDVLPAPYQKSDLNLPKTHDEMCHMVTAMYERGGARWLGCNADEQALKVLKRLYARTNKHSHKLDGEAVQALATGGEGCHRGGAGAGARCPRRGPCRA
jgi:hypothetical protein